MNKKEILLVIAILIFAVGATLGVLAVTNDSESHIDTSSEHADGHTDHENTSQGKKAPKVDLTNEARVTIDIKDYKYSKPNIKIKKGTTVTWTNQDAVEHNAMKEHDNSSHAHDAPKKEVVKPDIFAGPLLARGESYSFTFNEIGEIDYHCAPHPYMTGTVTVIDRLHFHE